jgi:hypothetical protein
MLLKMAEPWKYAKWKGPNTKGQMMTIIWFPLCIIPKIVKFIQAEGIIEVTKAKDGGHRGAKHHFGMMKMFWRWIVVKVVQCCTKT